MLPEFRRILCPVDQSDGSRRAFAYGVAIARAYGAQVNVLEVIDWTLPPIAGPIGRAVDPPADLIEMTRTGLEDFIAPARVAGVQVAVHVESGRVVETILDHAAAASIDAIVLGTHGRGGFQRLVLGSVTEKIIRRATCPVLTVPPGAEPVADNPFTHILCATDLSGPSAVAVEYAQALAGRGQSKLTLVHVVDVWPYVETEAPVSIAAHREQLEAAARRELTRVAATGPARDRTDVVVVAGHPKRELPALARQHAADLIVMGVAGRGAIDLAVLGSTTHHLIRSAPCPVLTVREIEATG